MRFVQSIIFLFIFASVTVGVAQKRGKKLPADLDKVKVVFLKYEPLPYDENTNKLTIKDYKALNKEFKTSNIALTKAAKNYPFEYTLSERMNYETLAGQGYKYVLESRLMEKINNGILPSQGNTIFVADLYLQNILTGEKFPLFEVSQVSALEYSKLMAKFNKMVKKQYKIK